MLACTCNAALACLLHSGRAMNVPADWSAILTGARCNRQEESSALEQKAPEGDSAPAQPEAQDVPSSMGTASGPDPVQLVLRIGRGFTPEPVILLMALCFL